MPAERNRHIVIVGGGTAGWLTAGLLAARLGRHGPAISVVEAPGVPILGVGEGTWPTMRQTLRAMGVSEAAFMAACDATFKQGSRFVGWRRPSGGGAAARGAHVYTHPFTPPHRFGAVDLAAAWQAGAAGDAAFDASVCFQTALCDQGLAPRQRHSPEYEGIANYAYHFDAGKLAVFLKAHCTQKLGVRHIADAVTGCRQDASGAITALEMQQGGPLAGDLFVDCSGGHAVLIGGVYGVGLVDCRAVLPVDRALAVQVPYPAPDTPIASVTQASAQSAGWIWDIGLTGRRGVGYVHASAHASPEEAEATLAAYVLATSGQPLPAPPRMIPINAGYRSAFWVHNCLAIGVAAGFVEPLEATSIAMVEMSANHLAEHLCFEPGAMAVEAARFNAKAGQIWRDAVDFLKLHYLLSDREEPFWQVCRDPASVPASLRDHLRVWAGRAPIMGDFPQTFQLFGPASYQYVLYGMGQRFTPAAPPDAQESLAEVAAMARRLSRALAPNRDALAAEQAGLAAAL